MKQILTMLVLTAGMAASACAVEVKVLSGGAVEPGMHAFAEHVKHELGHDLKIQFNTTPQIVKRLAAGEVFDIVIVPPAVLEQAAKDGKVSPDTRVPVGRVGAGVIVRNGAPAPNVATIDGLKQALLSADSVVYNSASSGLYLDTLFEKMGVLAQIKPKTTRYPDGASVMEHVIKGKGNEIGFGAITEIKLYTSKGLRFVGPLPAGAQNYTSYDAAVMSGAPAADAAKAVLRQLATPAGKAAFVSAGVE
jgi:molybdate transport system substrate-binding protein